MTLLTPPAPPSQTLYGPAGWTTDVGLAPLLLAGRAHVTPSFARFDTLKADVARTLLQRLPQAALSDRQNEAPTLRSLLEAASGHPDEVELGGYMVGPPRHDERLTVDMIALRSPWSRAVTSKADDFPIQALPAFWARLPTHASREALWEASQAYLGLDALNPPDEIEYFTPLTGTTGGWWMWWD